VPASLIASLFWTCALAVVIAQVMILRSSARVLGRARPARPLLEWGFAIGPAVVLALVLGLAWRAMMRPPTAEVTLPAPPSGIIS